MIGEGLYHPPPRPWSNRRNDGWITFVSGSQGLSRTPCRGIGSHSTAIEQARETQWYVPYGRLIIANNPSHEWNLPWFPLPTIITQCQKCFLETLDAYDAARRDYIGFEPSGVSKWIRFNWSRQSRVGCAVCQIPRVDHVEVTMGHRLFVNYIDLTLGCVVYTCYTAVTYPISPALRYIGWLVPPPPYCT